MDQVNGASAVRGMLDPFELPEVGGRAEHSGGGQENIEQFGGVGIVTQPPLLRPGLGRGTGAVASSVRSSEETSMPAESKSKSQGGAELAERVGYLAEHDLIKRDEKRNILTKNGELLVRRAGDKISVQGESEGKDRCAVSIYYSGTVYHHYFIFSDNGEVKRVYPVQATRQDKVVWQASGEAHPSVGDLTEEIKRRHEASSVGIVRPREDRSAPDDGESRAIAAPRPGGRSQLALAAIVEANRVERFVALNARKNLIDYQQQRAEGSAARRKDPGLPRYGDKGASSN